jgi:hypothetical protein
MRTTLRQIMSEHARLHAERRAAGADAALWHALGLDALGERAGEAALASFLCAEFLVLIDGRQVTRLEDEIVLELGTGSRFIGLPPLRLA